MAPKLCIMYLTDMLRPFAFPHFVKHLSQSKYLSEIFVLVLTHNNDAVHYDNYLRGTNIPYTIIQVEHDKNYLRKLNFTLEFTFKHEIPYIMKHDNDIVMSSHVYDYIFENLQVLDDQKNIVLTPTLTSGIPTCDIFMKDFLNNEQCSSLSRLFLNYQHGPLWGTDYTELNQHTTDASSWNAEAYYKSVGQRTHHYKGIHPVRMEKDAILQLNEYVLENKEKIFSKQDYFLDYDSTSPYFCNSVFCIKKEVYATLLSKFDLYVDNYDEVPLNRWRDMFGLNLVIIRKGVAIHPIYNTIETYLEKEKEFFSKL